MRYKINPLVFWLRHFTARIVVTLADQFRTHNQIKRVPIKISSGIFQSLSTFPFRAFNYVRLCLFFTRVLQRTYFFQCWPLIGAGKNQTRAYKLLDGLLLVICMLVGALSFLTVCQIIYFSGNNLTDLKKKIVCVDQY